MVRICTLYPPICNFLLVLIQNTKVPIICKILYKGRILTYTTIIGIICGIFGSILTSIW